MELKNKKYIFFDLDGTVIDSKPGVFASLRYAFERMQLSDLTDAQLMPFLGPPLMESFAHFCGLDEQSAKQAYAYFSDFYAKQGVGMNTLFAGVELAVKTLFENGKSIFLATSKNEKHAARILEDHHLAQYFTDISGAVLAENRSKKIEVLQHAMRKNRITQRKKCLMIGDRKYDIAGAKLAGISAAGVLYGYGSRQELMDAGADVLFETADDIVKCLI